VQAAAARFAEFLSRRRLKMTRERRAILEQVLSVRGHFDVDDLLALLRRSGRHASRATLYRTLSRLVECGLVHKLEMAQGQARYEPMFGRHHHDHMVCVRCGRIIEFESREIERLQDAVCRKKKFTMTGHMHQIRGYCQACARDHRGPAGEPRAH
jgi:Fur family ferric uptake transcriptional regulator